MKFSGILMVVFGVIWGLVAFNMDVSVTTEAKTLADETYAVHVPSVAVNNVGLMDERRNHLMGAGVVFIAGVVLLGFGVVAQVAAVKVASVVNSPNSVTDDAQADAIVKMGLSGATTITYCKKCTGMNNASSLVCFRCSEPISLGV